MYDVAGNGYIDLNEMTQIVKSIYHLIGRQQVQFILLFLGDWFFTLTSKFDIFVGWHVEVKT